jgi:hypothetical protein
MARRKTTADDLPHGAPVQVVGSVGDDETGLLRGMRGRVHGVNATYEKSNGERFVNVQLEGGAVVAMPERALKVRR